MREIPYIHERGQLPRSLLSIPGLAALEGAGLDELLEHATLLECSPGDKILNEGDPSAAFFIHLRGQLIVVKRGETIAVIREPGEIIGERSLLDGQPRSATVEAVSAALLLKVRPGFAESLDPMQRLRGEAVAFRFLAGQLARRLADTSQRLAEKDRESGVYRL
ncbi:MAG: cyclic nucleotide-binding domain-containing protein [Verrucomicrobiales bacterium]|jgi:CRP/FNR family cyclic AMP-dependent transcriptional regulator|nr:cyclic nucleotide-binding domain-containing protein [Verrucomicrobiales bacterium]